MKPEDITIRGTIKPISISEVMDAERLLGTRFPGGYSEYVTTFGGGTLGGQFIRVYTPAEILRGSNSVDIWHARLAEYWFWEPGAHILSKQKALESIIIADTVNGDEICFHPSDLERIYVLPRDSESIFVAGRNLWETLEWLCSSGIIVGRFSERFFDPHE
jgi:hypothetical protein